MEGMLIFLNKSASRNAFEREKAGTVGRGADDG
jgi:hypothetical protein